MHARPECGMTEISDALIRDIQAAMGALVRQQRPGLSHEVVQLDMPIGQMKTLFILWTAGKPQTMGQLAHALDVSLGTVTGLIDGLVQRGLARREEDPADRRLGSVVVLAVVLLFGAGIWAATQLQQDLLPNITVPAFVVITAYPGASPGVVDQQVTLPVVSALQGVAGVTTVDSTSSSGASVVTVQFKDGTDTIAARQSLSSSLDRARAALPPQAQAPNIVTFSTSGLPVLQYSVYANESLGDLSSQLRSVAIPKLAGLAGVSTVNLTGAPAQEIQVTVDPSKLATHGLTVA